MSAYNTGSECSSPRHKNNTETHDGSVMVNMHAGLLLEGTACHVGVLFDIFRDFVAYQVCNSLTQCVFFPAC